MICIRKFRFLVQEWTLDCSIGNVLESFNVYFPFKNVHERDYHIPGDHCGMVSLSFRDFISKTLVYLALITLLKFLQNCESQLAKHRDLFQLASKIINIFNLFITFGDTFLRTPEAYDEVFYETVRCYHIFDNLFAFGKFSRSLVDRLFNISLSLSIRQQW